MNDVDSPSDRLAARREHLMDEINTRSVPRRWTRKAAVLAGLTALVVGGGTAAVAGGKSVYRLDHGMVAIDGRHLTPQYQGRRVNLEQITKLNKAGKAMVSVNNIEGGCHGVSLYFDTVAEADAYGDGFVQRSKAAAARRRAAQAQGILAPTDPCADWKAPLPAA